MSSTILRTANGIIFPLTLLFALYMALKGHNYPGGGFIGGLIAAVALVLYRMSHGRDAMERLMPIHPRILVAGGLALAALTGIVPLFFREPLIAMMERFAAWPRRKTPIATPLSSRPSMR